MGEIEDSLAKAAPRYKEGPIWENSITYDTAVGNLQPIYFWILDFLSAYKPEKLVDSFAAPPGSSYAGELGARATKMQEEGMKILGSVNLVVQNVVRLIYDLRNFEMRLREYDKFNSKDKKQKEIGMLALKELWMNQVDSQRGMGSINNMAHQYGFTLLRPAFMSAMSEEMIDKMDLNDIVRRVLKPRMAEFFEWAKMSELEMRKRYELQRSYLKSQVATMKLYSSWVKPYLRGAEQLRMKETKEPSLVSIFGTMMLELALLAKKEINIEEEAASGGLPPKLGKNAEDMRKFYQVILVNFKFRTFPGPNIQYAGRVDISFKAYALNEDELLLFEKVRDESNIESMIGISEQITKESLDQLNKDIEYFLSKEDEKKEEKKESDTVLGGLFESLKETSFIKDLKDMFKNKTKTEEEEKEKEEKAEEGKKREEKAKKLKEEGVEKDSFEEKIVREFAELNAADFCFKTFDVFKKSQGMASFPSPFDDPEILKRMREKRVEIEMAIKAKAKSE